MRFSPSPKIVPVCCIALALIYIVNCAPEFRPWFLGGATAAPGTPFPGGAPGNAFTDVLIQEGTFINGQAVTTVTYQADDMDRRPLFIDFNLDGKADPVVAYQTSPDSSHKGVLQILLSQGDRGTVDYLSLTLDGGDNPWAELRDVAVGDIDGDGLLDLVAATREGVVYLHHPANPDHTDVLAEWGQATGDLELIEGTNDVLTQDELLAIVAQALGPTANLDNYIVTVEQGYTRVAVADFDNDGYNDIAASRRFRMTLEPKPDVSVQPEQITFGSVQVLVNPGGATSGAGWTGITIGTHERHESYDRDGAMGLWACDLDADGDLDLVSAASDDNNVQVAWFENPGGPGALDAATPWTQWRIGSVRGAYSVDVADLTGDGQADVVVTSPVQKEMVLFVQPETGPQRSYDWDSYPIVSFESFEPRDVKALDLDSDGTLELVVSGTAGAVRYFEPPADPTATWQAHVVTDFSPEGDVGLLGYGDLDGDGDLDLIAVVDGKDDNTDRVVWIRNELAP